MWEFVSVVVYILFILTTDTLENLGNDCEASLTLIPESLCAKFDAVGD